MRPLCTNIRTPLCTNIRTTVGLLAALVSVLTAIGCTEPPSQVEALPELDGPVGRIGALLCVSGPTAATAPNLERAAILAEELINGSTLAYPDLPPEEIPCRQNDTCGMWMGRSADGAARRGPLEVVIANSEERVDRGTEAARRLRDEYQVPAIVGPCSVGLMESVFENVTTTETLLVSPVVTADSISDLPDRTPEESASGLPGWVYRTVPPNYIQLRILGLVARNSLRPQPLVHAEDVTDRDCREEEDCADLGNDYTCVVPALSSSPERELVTATDTVCTGEPEGFCDSLGLNYECVRRGATSVCAQFRSKRFCVRMARPATAMILYQDTPFGRGLRDRASEFWVDREGAEILSEVDYSPDEPALFSARLRDLFVNGSRRLAQLKEDGVLPDDYPFSDTVVFLFAEATDGVLLLQEWSAQKDALGIPGAGDVFWVGPHTLRNRLLINQLTFETLRNLYVTHPAALDTNNGPFFEELFQARWGTPPGDFAANLFDAILLVALANERAGFERTEPGALEPNTPVAIKNSLQAVSAGCLRPTLATHCEAVLGAAPIAIQASDFADAMAGAARGEDLRLVGTSGDLSLSPAGDRGGTIQLWKVEQDGQKGRFFMVESYTPEATGITLEK